MEFIKDIINFLATLFMYLGNRNGTWFVRFHSLQALLSQAIIAMVNAYGFYWSLSIAFGDETISNPWIAYVLTAILFNLLEFVGTIYAAIRVRKGYHVTFLFFGPLTDALCRKDPEPA